MTGNSCTTTHGMAIEGLGALTRQMKSHVEILNYKYILMFLFNLTVNVGTCNQFHIVQSDLLYLVLR